ncbi:MAG: hypothetical protein GEV04_15575 [Actinophytocola sp.]|nr:hypothetical protein [Actinophytocola sp.]
MTTASSRLPTVPGALTTAELLALGDAIAAAMPTVPPRQLLPASYAAGLAWDAARWRALPAQLRDAIATEERRLAVVSSHAISSAVDWHRIAGRPGHHELRRRRAHHATPPQTPTQIRAQAAASWAAVDAIAAEPATGREAA